MKRIWPSYWPKGGMLERSEPFTWIIKGRLAASWWPDSKILDIYKKEGISVIINCSEFDNRKDIPDNFKYHHFHVPDYGIPSEEQIKEFLKVSDGYSKQKSAIVIHCVAGCGRTAQFIVAWAAHNNFIPKNMDPVDWIRKIRPCSLETKEQIKYARSIAQKFHQKTLM